MPAIVVYTRSRPTPCTACDTVKRILAQGGVAFETIDVTDPGHERYQEMLVALVDGLNRPVRAMPVVMVDGQVWSFGFQPGADSSARIAQLVAQYGD